MIRATAWQIDKSAAWCICIWKQEGPRIMFYFRTENTVQFSSKVRDCLKVTPDLTVFVVWNHCSWSCWRIIQPFIGFTECKMGHLDLNSLQLKTLPIGRELIWTERSVRTNCWVLLDASILRFWGLDLLDQCGLFAVRSDRWNNEINWKLTFLWERHDIVIFRPVIFLLLFLIFLW